VSREAPRLAVLIDIDWAADWMIDDVAAMLREHGLAATWFVTHASPAVDRLRSEPERFELAAHPNFLPGTTHGADEAAIWAHLRTLVPGATAVRMHGLVQNTNLLARAAADHGYRVDVTYVAHRADAAPHRFRYGGVDLYRIPVWWEDDFEFHEPDPRWTLRPDERTWNGVRAFAFHPIHLVRNAASVADHDAVRALGPPSALTREQVDALPRPAQGSATMLADLGRHHADRAVRVGDLYPSAEPATADPSRP
jgi:hypothetical protein